MCVYIYIYIYIYTSLSLSIYIYIHTSIIVNAVANAERPARSAARPRSRLFGAGLCLRFPGG